jgi:outer membrane receptor for ferrienterochelin and colicin
MQVKALQNLNLDFSNPELPNESITAIELGYVTKIGERVKLNFDGFYNQYENFIEFQPNLVKFDIVKDTAGKPAKVSAYGGELATKVVITSEVEGSASYAYLKNTSEDVVNGDPEHKFNVEATYRANFGLVANLLASYISERQWRISDPEKGNLIVPFTVGESLGGYTVLDGRLGYRFWSNRLEAGLIGKNLLDEHREYPGLADSDVDRDPFTPRETFGGEVIKRTGFVYVEGHF